MRLSIDSCGHQRACVLDRHAAREIVAVFAGEIQDDVLGDRVIRLLAIEHHFDGRRHLEPQLAEQQDKEHVGARDAGPAAIERAVADRVRIVADHEFARTHQAVIGHHLVRDAGLGVVKAFDTEAVHFMADERVLVGLRLIERRLMMVEQDEHAVRVPYARQTILEPRLQREIVHRLGGVVMAHGAVDARFDDVACVDGRAGEVVPRQ